MSVPSTTSLEIARPVIRGGDVFLNAAHHIGQKLVRPDFLNGGFIWGDSTPVGTPRFTPYGKLMLPLIQIAAPLGSETSALLHYIAQRMGDGSQPAHKLQSSLAHLALEKDVMDHGTIAVSCNAITVSTPPQKEGQELVLVPDIKDEATGLAVDFFSGEHRILMEAIHDNVRWHKRFAAQEQRFTPLLPFGSLPDNITSNEQATIVTSLEQFLPILLVVGEQLPPMVR